jgi:hypothetical protein
LRIFAKVWEKFEIFCLAKKNVLLFILKYKQKVKIQNQNQNAKNSKRFAYSKPRPKRFEHL